MVYDFSYLGSVITSSGHITVEVDKRQCKISVEGKLRKFFGGVKTVLGKIGSMCKSQKVWMEIINRQSLPIMS